MGTLFVAAGHDGMRIVSEHGSDWKNAQLGKQGETYRTVASGAGRFVAAGGYGGVNIFASTSDGVAWETGKIEAKYVKYIRGLGFDGQQFIGIGGDPGSVGSSRPFIVTSPDGKIWSDYIEISGKEMLRRLAFGKGLIVGVGDRGRRAASSDGGKAWQDAPEKKAIDTLADVTFGSGRFVGVGLHGLRMSSDDGVVWSTPQRGEEGEHLNSIVWTGNQFVAVGAGATYFSPDGLTWERKPNTDAPLTVAHGAGVFVGLQWQGRILLSSDAVEWKQVFKSEQHLEAVCFGG
jgi:hypothetical protein